MSIFCIGRNYVAHAHELGNEVPTSPVIFMKPSTAVLAEGKNFTIPSFTNDLHYAKSLSKSMNLDLEIINGKSNILDDFDKMINDFVKSIFPTDWNIMAVARSLVKG